MNTFWSGSRGCLIFTLSVVLSGTTVVLNACEPSSRPQLNTGATGTLETMTSSFVPREALVKFKPSVSRERRNAILKDTGTELIAEINDSRVQHIRIVSEDSVETVVKKLSAFPEVEYAEPNFRLKFQ